MCFRGGVFTKYEVSKGTLAIVPNNQSDSLVYEDEDKFLVEETPYEIMEASCKYFGSTYQRKKEGAKEILGAEYKVPIIIEDTNNLIVFPTTSPYSEECMWISLNRIKKFLKIDTYNTKIIFDNNIEIIVPCSYRTIENQVSRASRLDLILRKRRNI